MYWANPSLNFDWCRWWEEKKRTVSVQDWERKAADFGGDEEKDSAPDWQQLDSSAQQQLLQGTHLCWSSSEEVDAQYTHHSLGSCFGYVGSSVVFFFFFLQPYCFLNFIFCLLHRFDSLDNLDTLHPAPLTTAPFNYPRPHSAAAGYCAPSRNSSSRYSTGAIVSQRNASMDPSNLGRYVIHANVVHAQAL